MYHSCSILKANIPGPTPLTYADVDMRGKCTRICPCICEATPRTSERPPWITITAEHGSTLPQLPGAQASNVADQPLLTPSMPTNTDPPPAYKETSTAPFIDSKKAHTSAQNPSTVAALPLEQPMPNVEYLAIVDKLQPPVKYKSCGTCLRP